MSATLRGLQKDLSKGIKSIYLFTSEDEFILDEAVAFIKDAILPEGVQDFNFDNFYAREVSTSKVRDIVETLPVMAPQRLIVVKSIQDWKDKQWDDLKAVWERPVKSSVLVLVSKKWDAKGKWNKDFLQVAGVYHFLKPYDNQVPDWIGYLALKHNLNMHPEAVRLVHQLVGNNLNEIQNEIIKLKEYIGNKPQAEAEDVIKIVSRIKVQSIFDLTKSIGESDRAKALMCLARLLENGQSEVGILSLISRHVRILRSLKEGMREGYEGNKLSSFVGIPHFFLNEYRNQADRWNDKKIESTFRVLLETDRALKLSPLSSHIWLENFVIQTCN